MFQEILADCKYGYARVSSKPQEENSSLEAQKQEFIQQGVPKKNIRVEVGSAADPIRERPVFQKLIEEELQENDLLLVTKIDRCSRIKSKLIDLFFELRDYGLIENELGLTFNSTNRKDKIVLTKKVEDLNSKLITKLNYISFYEKIK